MKNELKHIIELEKKLHASINRQNMDFLIGILHADFFEFCRSGVSTDKADTLASLVEEQPKQIYSENYTADYLNENTVLLTYLSFEFKNNAKIKQTNRSSIWLKNSANQWQLRFHQGTAKKSPSK